MNLLDSANFDDKCVIVRADLDVDVLEGHVQGENRLQVLLPTLNKIFEKGAKKIVIIGHRGRPENGFDETLSVKPLIPYFIDNYSPSVDFVDFVPRERLNELKEIVEKSQGKIVFLENLRFWKDEEANDIDFAESLSSIGDAYVNEAFAASHRNHASIVSLPKRICEKHKGECFIGLRFEQEIEVLSKVRESATHPVISFISGVKKDKIEYIEPFKKFSDKIFIGGRLPEYLSEELVDPKVEIAKLNPDKEDITIHTIESFEAGVSSAGTIIVSGPMGKFEDQGHRLGTQRVLTAVVESKAYKVAGGGDTEVALDTLNLAAKFDWVSIGGGAMLEYLANGTLPGINALC
jgi:phosphoglycerate kinase